MATSTLTELIALTRRLVAFPAPPSGGADKLSDADILRWLNDWFEEMTDLVFGIPVYLKLTIETDGTIAVTDSNSTPAVTTITTLAEDYTYLQWTNVRSIGRPINRTTGISANYRAPMVRMNRNEPSLQYDFRNSDDYYEYYDYVPGKGLVLMPVTISTQNIIVIPYKQDYVRLATGSIPTSFFSEKEVMAAVNHAAYPCSIILDLEDKDRFIRDRDKITASFVGKKYTKDTGSALGFDNTTNGDTILSG